MSRPVNVNGRLYARSGSGSLDQLPCCHELVETGTDPVDADSGVPPDLFHQRLLLHFKPGRQLGVDGLGDRVDLVHRCISVTGWRLTVGWLNRLLFNGFLPADHSWLT